MRNKTAGVVSIVLVVLLLVCLAVGIYLLTRPEAPAGPGEDVVDWSGLVQTDAPEEEPQDDGAIPPWSGAAYTAVHGNVPYFTQEEYTEESFETYSELDELNRCGVACANVGPDLMPTDTRESIGSVKPSGWQTVRYDGVVDGSYLYNRCHLIGFQLTGENANAQNLITGTRYLNIDGMLGFENLVADYVKETGNHVLYRVTPVFTGDNLVADGVLMEGWSVEDGGEGVCFCVFAYNVQPGIEIDYATGESRVTAEAAGQLRGSYILNTAGKTYHLPDCPSAESMRKENRQEFTGTRNELEELGYTSCSRCQPRSGD